MLNKKTLYAFCAALSLFTAPAFADNSNGSMNSSNPTTSTDKIYIFEQDDEKESFTRYGFTRGDMAYLYNGEFATDNITNVNGEVTKIYRLQYPDQDCYLIAIIETKANNGKIAVNLGPVWFIEENGLSINEGDSIQVTGAKMRTNGRFVMIATVVTKNGKSINVRDSEGTALWGSPRSQKGNAGCMKFEINKNGNGNSSLYRYKNQ